MFPVTSPSTAEGVCSLLSCTVSADLFCRISFLSRNIVFCNFSIRNYYICRCFFFPGALVSVVSSSLSFFFLRTRLFGRPSTTS